MNKVKSGEEILKEFFESITSIDGVEPKLSSNLQDLYKRGKFTETNLKNMLDELIEEEVKNDEIEED